MLVPPGVVTVTWTCPEPAGAVAVIEVALTKVTPVALAVPNCTVAPAAKLAPVIVRVVPPALDPPAGEIPLTLGVNTYVKWSPELAALVFPPTLTVTSTVPEPAGAIAVMLVRLTTTTPVAAVAPKLTVEPE